MSKIPNFSLYLLFEIAAPHRYFHLSPVPLSQAIDDLMDTAALHRATASTEMNAVSSRSHSIFSLYLTGENSEIGAVVSGTLHLCDLAGTLHGFPP